MRGPDLRRLYDEHAQPLYAFLLNLTRNESDTQDVLQQVFLKLAHDENVLHGVRDKRSFLIRLAHNAALDLMRRHDTRERARKSYAVEAASIFAPATDPDEQTFRAEVAAALAALPGEQRTVVHLKLWEGLTFEQIAMALEIPSNTAASRYRYGLDKLRARLRLLYDEMKD